MNKQQTGNERRRAEAAKVWGDRKPEIEWLYLECEWPQQKVADYFGVTLAAIQKVMKRIGVKPRPRTNYGKRNGRYKDGSQSTLYRMMIEKDKCSKCGATEQLVIHHKNGDHQDNHLENLQVLCASCHNSHHRRLWWAKKKSQS